MIKTANKLAEEIYNPALGGNIQNLTGVKYLQKMIPNFITLALVVGIILFLFMMLIGGIQWITSGGDKAGIEGARGKITNAVVGVIILLAVFAILALIEGFFGVDILSLDIGVLKIE